MITVADALNSLGIQDWVLRGNPTNETEFNTMFKKVTGEDSNGSAIESSDTADFGVTWSQVSTKLTELQNDEAITELRRQRDIKLRECDHWGLSDHTMTSDQTTYRQALRDLPSNYTTSDSSSLAVDLSNLNWPTKP